MPIEGPLKELQIHDVFQLLDLGRKTGVLRVTSELRQNAGVVYFDNGGVVAAEIRSNPHPLGALLIRAGKVREDDVARAAGIQRSRPGHRLGDILVEMGALPQTGARASDPGAGRGSHLRADELVGGLFFVRGRPAARRRSARRPSASRPNRS